MSELFCLAFYLVCLFVFFFFFFFKQKTAYEMRISDWSSDVCSSDLADHPPPGDLVRREVGEVLTVEAPCPGVGLVEAGEEVEEGGLAGAVGADQRGDGAPLELDVVDVDGHEATESAGHPVGDEDRVGLGAAGDRKRTRLNSGP